MSSRKPQKRSAPSKKRPQQQQQRTFREVLATGDLFQDWPINPISLDSDVWQNILIIRQRSRDLFRTNEYFQNYRDEMWQNVLGDNGHVLRMRILEMEDRAVKSPDEKVLRAAFFKRRARILEWAATKTTARLRTMIRNRSREMSGIARAQMIEAGQPDIYANQLIEAKWKDWSRAQNCDVRQSRDYQMLRQMRLINATQDGGFFIRMIRDPKVNEYGFALQGINDEWCDFWANGQSVDGNEVRMGIEYKNNSWGLGKPVSYLFIKRQPNDWQFAIPGAVGLGDGSLHNRISADDIIHYARFMDNDSTRPAPWCASVIPKVHQLNQFELAEVIAARVAACKMAFAEAEPYGPPEGGFLDAPPDPLQINQLRLKMIPGSMQGVPYGVKMKALDFNHPTQNFPEFRKGMLRSVCAGMPGASYAILGHDYEGINFSAGKLDRLSYTDAWRMIQRFDIEKAERPIFEAWLEMALTTGAIPLPLSKFKKFNKPHFQGRRWSAVEPYKDVEPTLLLIANKLTSRTRTVEEQNGIDYEELLYEIAEEEMLMEELGMSTQVVSLAKPQAEPDGDEEDSGDDSGDNEDGETTTTGKSRLNGVLNGHS
jgi:lambda family phage portal protein